jgi:hypothetical protein
VLESLSLWPAAGGDERAGLREAHASGGHVSAFAEKDGNSPVSPRVRGAESLRPGRAARPAPSPTTHGGPATVLDLQRMAGNKAVAALLDRSAHRPDAAIGRADPLSVQKAPPPVAPSNAAVQDRINALELRTKALEGRQKATTQDLLWRGKFGGKMSSWKQAILRITGGLDAAQVGFTTAQAKQAEFNTLVTQLVLAAVTVGFAAGFEPLLSSTLMANKIGATAEEIATEVKRVSAIVEAVENPALAVVSSVPNIVGALPKTSTQPPSAPVPGGPTAVGSTAVGYLAENLEQVESHSQAIEQAFTLRATSLAALSDEAAAGINTAPQEAIYKGLFDKLDKASLGAEAMKDAPGVAKVLECHIWAAWVRQHAMLKTVPKGGGTYRTIDGFGSYIEDRFNQLGIAKGKVTLSGHWYEFNSSGWEEALLGWANTYAEPLKK